jgi:ankyrin repeat protein
VSYYDVYHRYSYPEHNAVIRARIDLLKKMPAEILQANRKDGFDMTPLSYAARFGLMAELEYLLAQGANPDIITWENKTATMIALERGHYKLAIYLIENGADASIAGYNGITAIHMAAGLNQNQIIAKIAENQKGTQNLDLADKSGLTPLDYAINTGASKAVIQLAASGAECRFSVAPQNDDISIFLSHWQQSDKTPFTMPINAEDDPNYRRSPINVTIPAELPQNVKPETFRNRGY